MNNMQSDKYSMAEKILRDIETIILNRAVEEFVIIPVTQNQNKSPVIHVENNLGLESWCIKHVYGYAYKTLLEVRKKIAKRKLLHEEYPNVNRLIMGALLINPDVSTFWNMRRELVCDGLLLFAVELKIARIVLSHKCKSNEAFSYRKWLLRKILDSKKFDKMTLYLLFNDELKVCDMTAEKAANNYHSWCHRTWCVENMLQFVCDEHNESYIFINDELDYTGTWISKHVSDHTGFYYRQFILNKTKNFPIKLSQKYQDCVVEYFRGLPLKASEILHFLLGKTEKQWNENEFICFYNRLCVLLYDYTLNSELQDTFWEHETLWCHRRFILHELFSLIYTYFGMTVNISTNLNLILANDKKDNNIVDNTLVKSVVLPQKSKDNGEKCPKISKCENDLISTSKIYRLLSKVEKHLIERCSKMKNRHGYFAQRHEKWIVYVLGLTNL